MENVGSTADAAGPIKPAKSFMGFTLLVGVELACFATFISAVFMIAVCSSTEPLQFSGLIIGPEIQVFAATWSFLGIPCAVIAGVGALHRVEHTVDIFFFYSCASLVFFSTIPVWFVMTSSLCDLVVHPDLQSQGTAFVCGFANTFVTIWGFMLFMTQGYMLFIIWSAAEDIKRNPFPELSRYEDALRAAKLPQISEKPFAEDQDAIAKETLQFGKGAGPTFTGASRQQMDSGTPQQRTVGSPQQQQRTVGSPQQQQRTVGSPQQQQRTAGSPQQQQQQQQQQQSQRQQQQQLQQQQMPPPVAARQERGEVSAELSLAKRQFAARGANFQFSPAEPQAPRATSQSCVPGPKPGAIFNTTSQSCVPGPTPGAIFNTTAF